jgi:hypothetical protein
MRKGIRLFVMVQFLLTAIGIPLYQHLCCATGMHAPLSECSMHEKAVADDCCADPDTTAGDCCADGEGQCAPQSASVSQNGAGSAHCCTDIDVSPAVKDVYLFAIVDAVTALPVLEWVSPPSEADKSSQFAGWAVLVFCDSSPPPDDVRLLLSSLLI